MDIYIYIYMYIYIYIHNSPLKGMGVRDIIIVLGDFSCFCLGFPLGADRNFERKLRI